MKKLIILIVAILLFGCKAKTITIEPHTTDTLRVEKIVKMTPVLLIAKVN